MENTISRFKKYQEARGGLISKETADHYLTNYKTITESEKENLILYHSRLAFKTAVKYIQKNPEKDEAEIFSTALYGLSKSLETFDGNRGYCFSTYAVRCIENEILMYFRRSKRQKEETSMEEFLFTDGDGNQLKLNDILIVDSEDMVENISKLQVLEEAIFCLNQLPIKERQILKQHLGFNQGRKQLTQKEISAKYSLSQSYISRLITVALGRLQRTYEMRDILIKGPFEKKRLETLYYRHYYELEKIERVILEEFYGFLEEKPMSIAGLAELLGKKWNYIFDTLVQTHRYLIQIERLDDTNHQEYVYTLKKQKL
ncbi:MAG: sigma-70 family RNA polymerase sigma factor [Firmicutes bacterium]|nr:sigma-70 family RNA polymerase sigma factor [Bacillota bacterium]